MTQPRRIRPEPALAGHGGRSSRSDAALSGN
ncbi:hypothetical protein FHS28_002086 [Roseateles terrae]|uniref:Uncharacterized protein n=1 Tax=Roseateles terrae TaxID=431060 RepID=A0ABR6GRE4_9BURK|nr:hypothetical protein [Roseateles terrae]